LGVREPYTSSVPLQTGEMGDDLAYYLLTSEQIPSAVGLGVYVEADYSVSAAGGILVQALPGAEATAAPEEKEDAINEGHLDAEGNVDYSRTFRSLSEGDVVEGVVVHIDREGVLVDVGTKSEGLVPPVELSRGPAVPAESVVSVGDRIDVYVLETDNNDGNLILSKKRADFEKAWDRVIEAFQEGKVLTAMVTDRVKGGLVVDLGIRGFVPGSHVGSGKVKNRSDTLDRRYL
jgi:predicted RNA-binding protein with RPS1 domain